MGTATTAGTISIATANSFDPVGNGTYKNTITGVSSLYPCVVSGIDNGIDWDNSGETGAVLEFGNMDFQIDCTTGGGDVDIKLIGDCEFDAVTVSSGDTLDINGQRVEFSGVLDNDTSTSDIKTTGGGLIIAHDSVQVFGSVEYMHDGDVNMIVDGGTGHDWRLGYADGAGPWCRNLLVNGNITHTDQIGPSSGSSNYNPENIIVGSGTLTPAGSTYLKDLTIATGGVFTPASGQVVDLYGDFTTSGGLIGKSALNLTGSEEVTGSDNLDEVATTNKFTIEAWFKASTDANYRAIFSRGTSWAAGNLYVYMNADGNVQASANDLSNTLTSTTAGLADSKWHHVAYTYDTTTIKLYIDGKLEATAASTSGINTQTAGFKIGDRDGANWVGNIGRVSVWKNALSETLIRKMFFMDWTTMAADSDFTDSDAIGWWQFDEGTSTAVEDLSSQSNDGTLNSAAWAGAGTFTYGTSNLTMTGTSKKINYTGEETVYDLTINGTVTLNEIAGNDDGLLPKGDFTVGASKTLSSTSTESIVITDNSNTAITIGSADTSIAGLYKLRFRQSGSINLPACTTPRVYLEVGSGNTVVATGDIVLTQRLDTRSNCTFNANGNTITTKYLYGASGIYNLINSTVNFTREANFGIDLDTSSTLLTGNTTLSGNSIHSAAYLPAIGGFEVVGDVSDFKIMSGGDLTVIGSVIDCELEDSTANIRQWHHTLDTQQLLDADEAGDDDLRLTKPALDNALELMTK